MLDGICRKQTKSAPDEEQVKEADGWSDAIKYLRLYDKKKELHVFAVNMKNIKVHEKRSCVVWCLTTWWRSLPLSALKSL